MTSAGMLAVYPDTASVELARTLDLSGYSWKGVATPEVMNRLQPSDGWMGAIVSCDDDPDGGWAMCRALRRLDQPVRRILVMITGAQIGDLEIRENLFDDFLLTPFHPRELEARLRHMFYNELAAPSSSVVEHAGLRLNLETYQASFGGRPLDLTYMEYELLKYFVQNPGRAFSREVLLSEVWGYEYFGGARTVDVHVRRLRAKLGEEHAHLIETVRSVGYRFGASKWSG
ncbi:MAG: winged helix-turn-helix domain-containing protein [Ilumatobacteraceae bacterium]